MKFSRQKKEPRSTRSQTSHKLGPKIHAYYTPQSSDSIKSENQSKRGANSKKPKKLIKLQRVFLFGIGLFIFASASVLSSEPVISARGENISVSVDRYSQATLDLLASSKLNSSKLTLRDEKIEESLRVQFPEIESVDVSFMIFGRKPTVSIVAKALPILLIAGTKVYAVTENGQIAGEKTQFPLLTSTISLRDESGVPISTGDTVFRSDDVRYIKTLASILRTKNRGVDYIRMTTVPREIYVKTTDKPYEVRLFLDDDVSQQVGSWFAVEKVVGEQGGNAPTQYIDVRAGEKVYWL